MTTRPRSSLVVRLASLVLPLVAPAVLACSSSGSAGGDAPAPLAPDPVSSADVSFYALQNAGVERIVMAAFAPMLFDACSTEIVDGCAVSTCDKPAHYTTGAALDPGSVSASSPSIGGEQAIALTTGFGKIVQSGAFADGEQVHVKITGGADLPAFEETVTIPSQAGSFAVDGCSSSEHATACALSTAGATMTWSGGAGARVHVGVRPVMDAPHYVAASCMFDGTKGSGRIPGAVLAKTAGQGSLTVGVALTDARARVHAGASHAVAVYGATWVSQKAIVATLP